ncbi:hypothetical protein EV44_g3126 [Erysiphe necator]|uniref:Uncharacterized protein n=1 Tax=Uncinula necator TaxID=52586 RepID=A0A0B1NZT5_UNCNE|nr:hypothetical protein EV44_g3126 [Erysiphe necator]
MAHHSGSWEIEKLTKENHEKWFRLMKAKFQSKGVSYILEFSLEDHARIAEPHSPNANSDEELEKVRDSIDKINLNKSKGGSSSHKKQVLNIEKKKEYMRDEGTLKFILLQGLDDDDQALLDDCTIHKGFEQL